MFVLTCQYMDNITKFNLYVEALEAYIQKNGNSKIPAPYISKINEKNIPLGAWSGYIRQRYRKNQLPLARIARMEQIQGWQWGPFQPGPATDFARNEAIRQLRIQGKSLREIADEFDLSRQRVHQIIRKLKIS
jgi:Mor family transcriptional regulator